MKYIFVDTDNGSLTPGTPVHTSSTWPANADRFISLATAVGNATVRAETDDITIFCQGVSADTSRCLISPSILAASVTVQGNLTGPKWDTTKYRIEYAGSILEAFYVTYAIGNVTIKNLQVQNDGTNTGGPYAFRFNTTTGAFTYTFDSCIARIGVSVGTATGYAFRLGVGATAVGRFTNCIAVKLASAGTNSRNGFASSSTPGVDITAYNSIAYNFSTGASQLLKAVNCAIFDNTDDFSTSVGTIQYCASDDGDGTNAVTGLNWAGQFVDYPNSDFNLKAGSALIGSGIGPTGDASVPTTDIAGNTRSGATTDIGVVKYVPVFTITSIDGDDTVYDNQVANITGTGFGTVQGLVYIDGVQQSINSWTNTVINITVEQGALSLGAATLKVFKLI